MCANQESKAPPSLDLSFEIAKGVLDKQVQSADNLDSKGTTLFSVASAVLGIGISAGVLAQQDTNILTYVFGGLSIIGYAWVIGFTLMLWRLRKFIRLDNPIILREWYWDKDPTQFKMEWLSHLEDAFKVNETELKEKTDAIRSILQGMAFEIICLVLAFAFML